MEVNVSDIKVNSRIREDYGDILSLMESLTKLGQIQPIVLDENMNLIAGGRRLLAAKGLGWDMIQAVQMKDLAQDEVKKIEVELEENIRRKAFNWLEEIKAKKALFDLKLKLSPDTTIDDVAKMLDVTPQTLGRELAIANAIERFPDIAESKDVTSAYTRLIRFKRLEHLKIQSELSETKDHLFHGDCVELLQELKDNSVDLILFDPPFGVGFGQSATSSTHVSVYGDYDDTIENYLMLIGNTLIELKRIIKPGGHIYMFSSGRFQHTIETVRIINEVGLKLDANPLFWIKTGAFVHRPMERYAINFEMIYLMHKGDMRRPLNKAHMATFNISNIVGRADKLHPAQKPLELYRELIEIASDVEEVVLDPMMGSGVSLAVARELNRNIIGFEREKQWFDLALSNIYKEETDGPDATDTTDTTGN